MQLVAKIDDLGKPAWIALMIVSFILFWPAGLAILLYLIWSGRMAFWKDAGRGFAAQGKRYGCGGWHRGFHYAPSSGNRAFDEYREETLRRLEEEQREFKDFLRRLRMAKDKAEFDQFMAERRSRSGPSSPDAGASSPQS